MEYTQQEIDFVVYMFPDGWEYENKALHGLRIFLCKFDKEEDASNMVHTLRKEFSIEMPKPVRKPDFYFLREPRGEEGGEEGGK